MKSKRKFENSFMATKTSRPKTDKKSFKNLFFSCFSCFCLAFLVFFLPDTLNSARANSTVLARGIKKIAHVRFGLHLNALRSENSSNFKIKSETVRKISKSWRSFTLMYRFLQHIYSIYTHIKAY